MGFPKAEWLTTSSLPAFRSAGHSPAPHRILCSPGAPPPADEMPGSVMVKRGRHSAKPEQVRRIIEAYAPGPYLELFGRSPATGWTVFGNQIDRGLLYWNS